MMGAPLQKARTWVDEVAENELTSELDVAYAMLIVARADRFGVLPRLNPRRLASELGDTVAAILASRDRLVQCGHLQPLPRRAGGGHRIVMRFERPKPTLRATADVIPYSHRERRGRWARIHAARMLEMPREQAEAHLQRVLRQEEKQLRGKGATDDELRRQVSELGALLRNAYWWAVMGGCL
jgi:hypothetical protein